MASTHRLNKTDSGIALVALGAVLSIALGVEAARTPQAAQSQSSQGAARLSSIEVILPSRLVAGAPATLATLGADHRLVGHVSVELENGTTVETDATGRANFTAPSGMVLIAKAGGGVAATLVDSRLPSTAPGSISAPRFAALHNRLNVCGGGFDGNAEANHVTINGEPALVLAASPECLVVIPREKAAPGVAKISVGSAAPSRETSVTLVALDFQPPNPTLTPGEKGWLVVRARGSDERLRVIVTNESSAVLRFVMGDVQELTTSGGPRNVAHIQVQAVSSGDFSFNARIVPPPNVGALRRFLQAAEPLASVDVARKLKKMEGEAADHPKSAAKIRAELDRTLEATSPGDLHTFLEAARSSL